MGVAPAIPADGSTSLYPTSILAVEYSTTASSTMYTPQEGATTYHGYSGPVVYMVQATTEG